MKTSRLTLRFEKTYAGRKLRAQGGWEFSPGAWVQALMGPSGAGKTTLARFVAGLGEADRGELRWDEQIWFNGSRAGFLPPQLRRVGYLAQGDRLFPHLNVAANIAYGLRRWPGREREAQIEKMLSLTGLAALRDRLPRTLSGGEKRRAALGQVLAIRPRLLILDEPFAGLDAEAKAILWRDTKHWIEEFSLPTLLITHDPAEAAAFGAKLHLASEAWILRNSLESAPR